jgi:shikimate kinase
MQSRWQDGTAGMKSVLLTGMSGTGKSTLICALAARGYKAIDSDTDEWLAWVTVADGTDQADSVEELGWVWHEDRSQRLLSTQDADVLFVSGCKSNQGTFYAQFDHIVLLSAPVPLLMQRLATRTTNRSGGGRILLHRAAPGTCRAGGTACVARRRRLRAAARRVRGRGSAARVRRADEPHGRREAVRTRSRVLRPCLYLSRSVRRMVRLGEQCAAVPALARCTDRARLWPGASGRGSEAAVSAAGLTEGQRERPLWTRVAAVRVG